MSTEKDFTAASVPMVSPDANPGTVSQIVSQSQTVNKETQKQSPATQTPSPQATAPQATAPQAPTIDQNQMLLNLANLSSGLRGITNTTPSLQTPNVAQLSQLPLPTQMSLNQLSQFQPHVNLYHNLMFLPPTGLLNAHPSLMKFANNPLFTMGLNSLAFANASNSSSSNNVVLAEQKEATEKSTSESNPVKNDGLKTINTGLRLGEDGSGIPDLSKMNWDVIQKAVDGKTGSKNLQTKSRRLLNLVVQSALAQKPSGEEGKDLLPVVSRPNKRRKKGWICGSCGKEFLSQAELRKHAQTHIGEKRRLCLECGKGFDYPSDLRKHRRIHTGEQPFACTVCGRRFSDKSNMLRHLRGHTGEKPYQCRVCGKKFGNNSHMKRHLKTHSGLKPHKCSVCGKGFRTSWYVKIHEANQHFDKVKGEKKAVQPVQPVQTDPQAELQATAAIAELTASAVAAATAATEAVAELQATAAIAALSHAQDIQKTQQIKQDATKKGISP